MRQKWIRIAVVLAAICGGILLLSLLDPAEGQQAGNTGNSLLLSAPAFLRVAHAAPGQQSAASFLDSEAGIAAYTRASGPIDLAQIRSEFRTIERETTDYIVGSVGIPDYPEEHDPHVYVHRDGWVLAYYLAHEPASHIMDLRHYDGVTIASTKLENAMNEILVVLGQVPFTATYYDFRYPNATHLMLIAEAKPTGGDDSFDVQLPNGFIYYERAWAHTQLDTNSTWYSSGSKVYLDEVLISALSVENNWKFAHGSLTAAQLPPGVSHTVRLNFHTDRGGDAFCGLALVYKEVP